MMIEDIVETFFIMDQFKIDFITSFNVIIELWKTDTEFATAMNIRVLEVAGMIFFGGIVYSVIYLIQRKKKGEKQPTPIQPSQSMQPQHIQSVPRTEPIKHETLETSQLNDKNFEKYELLVSKFKNALTTYVQNKNADELKLNIIEIKRNHVNTLSTDEKQRVRELALKEMENKNLTPLKKKSVETLLKIVK